MWIDVTWGAVLKGKPRNPRLLSLPDLELLVDLRHLRSFSVALSTASNYYRSN